MALGIRAGEGVLAVSNENIVSIFYGFSYRGGRPGELERAVIISCEERRHGVRLLREAKYAGTKAGCYGSEKMSLELKIFVKMNRVELARDPSSVAAGLRAGVLQ